jgi:two-component system cell cycle response regulator DivK
MNKDLIELTWKGTNNCKPVKGRTSGLKILVVDDYEDTLLMMRLLLELRGYRVVEAVDGEQAIEIAWREIPDIILMDLTMPKVDGFAAARRIREDPQLRDVPIVAVSAHVEQPYRTNALAAGINAFVTKPIDFDFLDDLLGSPVKSK